MRYRLIGGSHGFKVDKHEVTAWLSTVAVILFAGCAARQPARSFRGLQERVHSGNTVYVTDITGRETKGKVVELSASALVLDVKGIQQRMDEGRVRHGAAPG